ncbi:B12-binding domain-containing radical SAM protein [Candidatus Woesearchaeota archaeon CG10_big_fil_rev_8_21_14_0_10_34_8]|nr:MAG: B12-binding domain-containing radical SAM protein [Candidatus Woesearchaeota archaeon CG10_big_fil_rev_8_21_14_0_10_34_8]
MKVLFLYPKYPDTFWSFKHCLPFIGKKASFPPLGLLTVASLLPKNWEKKLVDLNIENLKEQDISWADMVFISGMIVQKESAQECINLCKQKGKTVVAGGPVFMTMHEQFNNVDHFILNEAEITLPLFLKDLEQGSAKKMYTSSERPDITSTPIPQWDLINVNNYASMPVQYSRGCPFNCEFCDIIIMNGRIPRTKTPEQMLAELQELYNTGWKGSVFVVDDNFIGNKKKVKELLPSIINWQKQRKYPFIFLTEASTNLADDEELMDLMVEANFSKVFLGIETPNIESLKEIGKMQNVVRDLNQTVKKIHNKGLMVMGGFIVGFDNDTNSIFEKQIQFIQNAGIAVAMTGILTALPKTRLWDRLKKEQRLLAETTGNNTKMHLNFIPKMGAEKLVDGYAEILKSLYDPKNYYKRVDTFLKMYNPKVKKYVRKDEIKAFFRSMWKIGLCSKQKIHFWKLFFSNIFKIKSLPVAIQLSIYGYHLQKIAEKNVEDMKLQKLLNTNEEQLLKPDIV